MKKHNDTALAFFITGIIFCLTYFSAEAKSGAENAIKLCAGVIVPSLLPILLLTNLMLLSRASSFFERALGGFFRRVFRLPESAVTPVFFGLIGGYPTGAVLTLGQYRAGVIDSKTAARIMRFNLCGGVAFIISSVGSFYGSAKIGATLYIINILSSLIIAVIGTAFERDTSGANSKRTPLPLSSALTDAAEISSKSVILMSAYIILFGAVTGVAKLPQFLTPIIEITNGIFTSVPPLPLPYCAFFLSFGGLCIHLQILGMLGEMGVKYSEFFIFRLLGAVISFALCKIYTLVFPQSATVFADSAVQLPYQFTEVNSALGIITMLGCAAIVLDIENRKIKL